MTAVSRAHMFDMAEFPAPHSCNTLFSHTQSRAYLSAPRLPVPPTYVNADFSPLHRPTSEFMFSDSPDKSPAESPHRPGTAMPPSRRKSFHNELEMALEQDTRRSAASLSSLVIINFIIQFSSFFYVFLVCQAFL